MRTLPSSRGASGLRGPWRWLASWCVAAACLFGTLASPAVAAPHDFRVPLQDGKVSMADVSAALSKGLGVTGVKVPGGSLDVSGLKGSNFVAAMNEALGDGCRVTFAPDAVVLHVDREKLPQDCDAMKRAVRLFTAVEAPEATAAQQRYYGLHLPPAIDPKRPLVVLVHGLDSSRAMWGSLTRLLEASGYQVAFFAYPSDGPVAESGALLGRHLAGVRQSHPGLKIDLVCHSMGGLVSRAYVEGPDYPGGVDRLIMLGTPNAGSNWSRWRLALEVSEHYRLWRDEPGWSPTWMITDGLGEAGSDLRPGSPFLTKLNANPRRDGVRYTVVAGNQHPVVSTCADWWECSSRTLIRGRTQRWWGFRHAKGYMEGKAVALRARPGDSDGPVAVESTKLAGVDDFVVVHADHASLCWGETPGAWEVIKDRLGR